MKLTHAVLCADVECSEVWDLRLNRRCIACGFSLFLPLSRFLNRGAKKEVPDASARSVPAR